MSVRTQDRTKLWLIALLCGIAGFAVGQRFTFTEASPVETRLPAVDVSVREIDAILSVRADSLRKQVTHLPVRKAAPQPAPARVVAPRSEPVRPTKSTEEIRVDGVDYRVLYDNFRQYGSGSFECSWKFTVTNYGKQPFSDIATFSFVDVPGNVITNDQVVVYVNPGETRSFRDTISLEDREFRRIARTAVSFQ